MITLERILVPLDGSLAAETALPLAEALAQKFESELHLLHVIELSPALAGGLEPTFPFESSLITIREWAYKNAASYLSLQIVDLRRRGVNVKSLLVETSAASPTVAERRANDESCHSIGWLGLKIGRKNRKHQL